MQARVRPNSGASIVFAARNLARGPFVQPVTGIAIRVTVAVHYVPDVIHVLREPTRSKAGSPEARRFEGINQHAPRIASKRDGPVPKGFTGDRGHLKREIYKKQSPT